MFKEDKDKGQGLRSVTRNRGRHQVPGTVEPAYVGSNTEGHLEVEKREVGIEMETR